MGWIRTGLTILSFVGSMYYFKGKVDAHIDNKEVHPTKPEIMELCVTRREYDVNIAGLRDDVRYLRNRMDILIDTVNKREVK